jgi:hypothetical protein
MASQDRWKAATEADLLDAARELGLRPGPLERCFASSATREAVKAHADGTPEIEGTPALYVTVRGAAPVAYGASVEQVIAATPGSALTRRRPPPPRSP